MTDAPTVKPLRWIQVGNRKQLLPVIRQTNASVTVKLPNGELEHLSLTKQGIEFIFVPAPPVKEPTAHG